MSGRIFLLAGDNTNLLHMQETAYDSERLLQELLAKHPDLLAGDQIDTEEPRRWLLVTREMRVPGEEGGSGRWSLDHLFLDQAAVPTLVEVKRSTDIRLRREVVGQMLDYAANAVAYWPVEEIRTRFESRCEEEGKDADEEISAFLGDDDSGEFWQRVKTNLQAGRIRMVFVADVIPPELRRIVEFLNSHLDPTEVLAVEIKQYVGEGVKTLVPRVIGMTESARTKKSGRITSGKQWDEASFLATLRDSRGAAPANSAKAMLDWITPKVTEVWWGRGSKSGGVVATIVDGGRRYQLFRMATNGRMIFRLDWLDNKPPFTDETLRRDLRTKIGEIPGIQFGSGAGKRARLPLESLADPEVMRKAQSVIEWAIEKIRSPKGA